MKWTAAMLALAAAVGLTALAADVAPTATAPTPKVVPVSWQLDFEYQAPQPITIRLPGRSQAETFWYMLYSVANRTGADQGFFPSFDMYTDTGKVVRSDGAGVPTGAFLAIQKRHNDPLLMNMVDIRGKLLQGEDNGKRGVAIWPDFDHDARKIDIFISGLSGERESVKLPVPGTETIVDEDGKPKQVAKTVVVLSKTLKLSYAVSGEAASRTAASPKKVEETWVMR